MATDTAATQARHNTTQQVGYLRKHIAYTDNGSTLNVGVLPAGAIVVSAGVIVSTAFDGNSANTLDIGTSSDTNGFATLLALGTVGNIVWDELATSNDLGPYASDTTIQCVVTSTASATAGAGEVYVMFIEDNDQ